MTLSRKDVLRLSAAAAASTVLPIPLQRAAAQSFPARTIRIIVQVPAGGGPDIVARLFSQWLSDKFGQPVIVENKPGASGNVATEFVARTTGDGYTLLFCTAANSINPSLFNNLRFNFPLDFAPVALIGRVPLVMEVNPAVPANTVSEFIAYAKANPGKINMASAGNGTGLHVAGELFKMMAGVDLVHVPYRGEAAVWPDLLTGKVHVMFGVVPSSLPYIRSGQMRALAVTANERMTVLPDVPAMAEFLPGYEASGWYGIVVPKETPSDIVDRLNKEINAALADPAIKTRLGELGCLVAAGTPSDMAKFVASEIDKWGKVIRTAGIKAE